MHLALPYVIGTNNTRKHENSIMMVHTKNVCGENSHNDNQKSTVVS